MKLSLRGCVRAICKTSGRKARPDRRLYRDPQGVGHLIERANLIIPAPNPSPTLALLPFLHLRLSRRHPVERKADAYSRNQSDCDQQKLTFHNRVSSKIPGYASLPACQASINRRVVETRTLEAMRTQG